jgi:hypothetical protein
MIMFGSPQPIGEKGKWRQQLEQFVQANQQELAALSWGLFLEKGESDDTLGIDLQPTPRFVFCPKAAIEKLNGQVDNQIQEILGFVDAHKPEKEVLLVGIGNGQIKLIQFEPELAPPICFEQVAADVNTLLERLEQRMSEQIKC